MAIDWELRALDSRMSSGGGNLYECKTIMRDVPLISQCHMSGNEGKWSVGTLNYYLISSAHKQRQRCDRASWHDSKLVAGSTRDITRECKRCKLTSILGKRAGHLAHQWLGWLLGGTQGGRIWGSGKQRCDGSDGGERVVAARLAGRRSLTGQSASGYVSGMNSWNLYTPPWYKPCLMNITPCHTAYKGRAMNAAQIHEYLT